MATAINALDNANKQALSAAVHGGVFNAEHYGASPENSYSDNNTAIQAALTAAYVFGGGKVSITKPGVYYIGGATLRQYPGTEFHWGQGVILRQASSATRGEAGRCLLANDGYLTPVEGNITSITSVGRVCTVNHVAHGRSVGQWVVIYGTASDGYGGVHRITSVTADTFTYLAPRWLAVTTCVASAYTGFTQMKWRLCDENISITGMGTIDYDNTNTPTGLTSLTTHAVIMAGIHNLLIEDVSSINSLKYCFFLSGVRKAYIRATNTYGPSDGIHCCGSCSDIDVFAVGTEGGDNNVAFGSINYTGYNIMPGPMEGLTTKSVGQSKGVALRLYGSAEHAFRSVKFEDIRGGCNEQDVATIQITMDTNPSMIGGGNVNVKDILIANAVSFTTGGLMQVQMSGTIGKCIYKDATIQYPSAGIGRLIVLAGNCTIDTLEVHSVHERLGHSVVNIDAGASVNEIVLNGVDATCSYAVNSATNNPMTIRVVNCKLLNPSGSFRNSSTSGVMTIKASNSNCTTWLARTAAQMFVVDGHCIRADASWINRTDGVMFYNTNAALGTLGKAGIVLGTGTGANSWKLLENTTLAY